MFTGVFFDADGVLGTPGERGSKVAGVCAVVSMVSLNFDPWRVKTNLIDVCEGLNI